MVSINLFVLVSSRQFNFGNLEYCAADTAIVFAVQDDINIVCPAACIQPILDSHFGLLKPNKFVTMPLE